jgi:alanine racemase
VAICVTTLPSLRESDWIGFDTNLPHASAISGMSQYELITALADRFDRTWT